jgi:hypothetical protein
MRSAGKYAIPLVSEMTINLMRIKSILSPKSFANIENNLRSRIKTVLSFRRKDCVAIVKNVITNVCEES